MIADELIVDDDDTANALIRRYLEWECDVKEYLEKQFVSDGARSVLITSDKSALRIAIQESGGWAIDHIESPDWWC